MNRDELLEACFGTADVRLGEKVVETTDDQTGALLGHLDIDYRRVVVMPPTRPGPGIGEAATTLVVAVFHHLAVDPGRRGQGLARELVETALEHAATHQLVLFATVLSDPKLATAFGFARPEGAPERFHVRAIGDDEWPEGRVQVGFSES